MSLKYQLVTRKNILLASLLALSLIFFAGCKKTDSAAAPAGNEAHQHAEGEHDHHDHDHEGHDHAAHEEVQEGEAAEGEGNDGLPPSSEADKADPNANKVLTTPINVEDVPDGAWYCHMGTVHYYRHEKGDGKCPVCGMELVQKTAEKAE